MDWFGEQGKQRRYADAEEQRELRRNICGDGFNTDCFGALQYNFETGIWSNEKDEKFKNWERVE